MFLRFSLNNQAIPAKTSNPAVLCTTMGLSSPKINRMSFLQRRPLTPNGYDAQG
jgi:hypothetical protein